MENSWQMKCGSANQSMASSTSHELRNQMEMVSGHCFYPPVAPDLRSTMNGRVQDSMYPNIRNVSSRRLGNAELGNSFLALLSGPPSMLQCDPQELPNLNAFSSSSSKLPIDGGGVPNIAIGTGVPPPTTGLLCEHQINRNMQNGANICSSSRAAVNSSYSSKSILHDGLQTANLGLPGSDLANAVIHQLVPSNEKAKDFSSVKGKWKSASSVNVGKLCSSNIPISQKGPLEALSSVSSQSSVCTSGDLLLSNTGLVGIVCSCHRFHMSVAKFCEHLGLRVVNPGDAVHMESGETLTRWRKHYFQKFGIRVPDDQSGWDWPEALSATAGLVKSSVVVPSVPNNSDLAKLVGSSGSVSGQRLDNVAFHPHTDQNSMIHMLHEKEQRYGQGDNNHLPKGLINTLQGKLQAVADNQKMECPISRCSTSSKFVDRGPDSGLQSISAYIDSLVMSRNASFTNPISQNSRILGKSYDVSKIKNSCDGVTADKVAVSSNIELRLGQPYQQSQSPGNSVTPVFVPKSLDTLLGPPKSLFREQMIHNAGNCGEKVESRQYYQCSAGPSSFSPRREQSQLNLGNHAFGISNVIDTTTKLENAEGNMNKSSVVPLVAHFNAPPERNENSKANYNMVISDHIMPKPPNYESHTAISNPVSVPWSVGNGLERQLNLSEMDFSKLKDKGKGTGCLIDGSYAMTDKELKIQKHLKNPTTFTGAVSESGNPCFSAVHEKSHFLHQSSGVPPDAFDARNLLNHPEKVPFLGSSGHVNHVFLRPMAPPIGSGQILQSQAISMAFPSATSTSIPGMTPTVSKLEGININPYLLDENMRLLALRQVLELSKQQHTSLAMDLDKGRVGNLSNFNAQHPFVESTFGEQRLGPNITSPQHVSGVAMVSPSSGAYTRLGVNVERTAPVTDLNNFFDFSTSTQGNPLLSREVDLQCQFSHDCLPNKQLSLRGKIDTASSERPQCYQRVPCAYFQGQCGCATYTKCSGGNCESRVGSSTDTFKDQLGNVNGETSMLAASEHVKDDVGPNRNIIPLGQQGKSKGPLPKTIVCHSSQWRDVPSKFKGVSVVTGLERSADELDGRGHMEGQLGHATAKCSYGTMKIQDSLKEQEMSNVSSGCSAAAVTQASIQINNMDSPTVDAGNTRYVNNHLVDEGSGIDKCWSSDDALESERSAEFLGSNSKTNFSKEGSSKVLNNQSSRSLLDELKLLDALTWKKNWNQFHTRLSFHGKVDLKKSERGFKTGKRKKTRKFRMLEAPFLTAGTSVVHHEHPKGTDTFEPGLSKDVEMLHPSVQETYRSGSCSLGPGSKFGRSTLSSSKELSRKRDLQMVYDHRDGEDDYQMELNSNSNLGKIHDLSGTKKLKRGWTSDCLRKSQMEEQTHVNSKNTVRCKSFGFMKVSSLRKTRPVVCGKYGEISSGEHTGDASWRVKLVPLSKVLKTARKCSLPENCKPKVTYPKELKKAQFCGSDADLKKEEESGIHHASICNEMNIDPSVEGDKIRPNGNKLFVDEKSTSEEECDNEGKKKCRTLNSSGHAKLKPKSKEIRKRSLLELTKKGRKFSSESFAPMKSSKSMSKMKMGKILKNVEGNKHHIGGSCKVGVEKFNQEHKFLSAMDLEAFCCVCGGSNKDEINCLLECSRCFIKVHQACYGVSRVPKGHWYCRPCRTSSKDIVCVLCGYSGGAMTQALRSRTIVKSLLKAWNIETECRPKNAVSSDEIVEDDLNVMRSPEAILEGNNFPVLRPVNIEPSSTALWKVDSPSQLDNIQNSSCCVHNSITAGVLDSTVKQWVHMVCGLWTPGTRCPNVDTMSAFDVSGASRPKANVVCSMCNRPGGSCIQCRVVNCSVQFHPWCAHRKGLLQSEVEGVENENVGFYGRCVLHATHPLCESHSDPIDNELDCSGEKELTCARTEGYKGRKRDGFWYNLYGWSRGKSGLVPQEQLNAWIHINGQKSSAQVFPKLPIEYDCRKEYARHKQAKGWKHLVVYKSGIHALGLYTSRFISRGEMVVEYVGEIVGLRVADKRENEYDSGRKLQYKSACYFFRIDKEHIIDATCKGGIARFVNHSCLPNCVAKVISVRNDKKVVFFAERDIYPGEEITYDYHFNHEDEGKKIPCFCNSKNCRRYLN
ncbi:uncharacterized protein LOC116138078 isoform X3 [Pistacia vera]|uniref:uncharacterized protein LOC116138078 isoform X3 n=1 Tax=Pistacia vera TaxID=55513 RepID=UPI0012633D20|nr:uncharacterized protein LOC116138078 isoform X3 [Pistacia vera]